MNINDELKKTIEFLDNILLLDSIEKENKKYNMIVDYMKKKNFYILKLVFKENDSNILDTKCVLENKKKGSIIISDIIKLVTNKYKNDLIIDVKELDDKNNCTKFGRRIYTAK